MHTLVEQAPQLLPLSGAPQLVVVGREVPLGGGYADLVVVERNGRLVVIEVKLARNAEARRAIVAQVLTYAAYLKGLSRIALEQDILGRQLHQRNYQGLDDAVASNDQEGAFDREEFGEGLEGSLTEGRFRLVLVLDEAPPELIRLVGYLESVTDKLVIDLITVSAYQIDGTQILVPQRVDAERPAATSAAPAKTRPKSEGHYVEGADDFLAAIEQVPREHQQRLRQLSEWALDLERERLAKLGASGRATRHETSRRGYSMC